MLSRQSVKPLELVISAIHCLKERNGSSPQNIFKYLLGKYNASPKALKNHIHAGLKRGLSFGLITHKSGLYRLNDVLNPPKLKLERKHREKFHRKSTAIKKRKLKSSIRKAKKKPDKPTCSSKYKRKIKKSKEKKYKKKKKSVPPKDQSRRILKKHKGKKFPGQNHKSDKIQKTKVEKVKKPTPEKDVEIQPLPIVENTEVQRVTVNNKENKIT